MSRVVHELGSIDSTNEWVRANVSTLSTGSVAYSHHQVAGRGRQGRSWVSLPGDSLACSLLVASPPPGVAPTWVPLLAGVSLVEVVRGLGVTRAVVKWPNDVLVEGSKLAGILVEVLPDSRLVVGMGINLHSTASSLPDPHATSLALQGVSVTDSVAQVIAPVAEALAAHLSFAQGVAPALVHERWEATVSSYLSSVGREVDYEVSLGVVARGVAKGLAEDGALIVVGEHGEEVTVRSGDIFHIERS